MAKKYGQKIVVFITLTSSDKSLILNGIKIASIFKKELCLTYSLKCSQKKDKPIIRQKLLDYTLLIKKEIPTIKSSILIIDTPIYNSPLILAEDHEAILLIASHKQLKKYAHAIRESPIPFLFINASQAISTFKKIVLPLDLRKGNNDSILWCSWFGRFNHSEIKVIAANDKIKESQKNVIKNILLAKKIFRQFSIPHQILKGSKNSLQNSHEAIDFCTSTQADMLILLGSSVVTPLDWLLGLPEHKHIKKISNFPILIINPRRDNYILCD